MHEMVLQSEAFTQQDIPGEGLAEAGRPARGKVPGFALFRVKGRGSCQGLRSHFVQDKCSQLSTLLHVETAFSGPFFPQSHAPSAGQNFQNLSKSGDQNRRRYAAWSHRVRTQLDCLHQAGWRPLKNHTGPTLASHGAAGCCWLALIRNLTSTKTCPCKHRCDKPQVRSVPNRKPALETHTGHETRATLPASPRAGLGRSFPPCRCLSESQVFTISSAWCL